MKTFATILLLTAGIFVKTSAQTTNSIRTSPGSLEIVLNLQKGVVYSTNMEVNLTNVHYYSVVAFSAIKDITMEVTFRNVGEEIMSCSDELFGLTVIWDGKEYKGTHEPGLILAGFSKFPPKTAWQAKMPLLHYDIPSEALTSGRHTIAVKDAGVESNILTTFIEPDK